MTAVNLLRVLNLVRSMILWIPGLTAGAVSEVVASHSSSNSSAAAAAWIWKTSRISQVGHCAGEINHSGPWFHFCEVFSWSNVMPLVSKSAGLSAEGQYLHLVEMDHI